MHGAADAFMKSIELNPDDSSAYHGLSRVMQKLGNVDQAKMIERKAKEVKESGAEMSANKGLQHIK